MVKITYLGHSAFIIENNRHRLIIDPFISGNPSAKIKVDELKNINFIIVTHAHGDHLGDTIDIAKNNNSTVISTYEIVTHLGKYNVNGHPLHIGGSAKFPFGRVKLTVAHHGNSVQDENRNVIGLGMPAGALITIDNKTLYHAGDTGLFYDMKLIGEMNKIDAAMLPIGDNFTMDINDAVKAVEFINPRVVIPMHYNTFDLIKAEPKSFIDKVKNLGKEAVVINIGGSYEI